MRIVVALGGNAMLARGERPDAAIQLGHIRRAAAALAPLADEHELLICHGNGPQVGLLAMESAGDASLSEPYPLDVLGAQTQGMIGYWLAQSLHNAGVTVPVVTVLTQTVISAADPAFEEPTKFIGPVYPKPEAEALARRLGWSIAADGEKWRRVVPSPEPVRIVERDVIADQLRRGAVVICGGGGGAPVTEDPAGRLTGADAVVDKDLTAAMLAIDVQADLLLLLTDVPAVMRNYGQPDAAAIASISLAELAHDSFPAGSMGPKIEGCRRFVAATGQRAAIGSMLDVTAIIDGTAGTTVTR